MAAMQWIRIEERKEDFLFNFKRKAWHMLGLLAPAFFYFDPMRLTSLPFDHATKIVGLGLNLFLLVFLVIVDLLRFRFEGVNTLFVRVAGPLLKTQELKKMNATVPYLTATFLLFCFCQDLIAGLACTFLMIGDPMAAYIGGRFGRVRFWNGKSLEGMLGFFLAGLLAAGLFGLLHSFLAAQGWPNSVHQGLTLFDNDALRFVVMITVGAAAAAVTEFFSTNRLAGFLDDNLEVPLAGGLAMALSAYLMDVPLSNIFFDAAHLFARS
ncbi:MAG TPA: dolichol kinase [Leptospiraceae bacterium]|nr:dolichol kinase [Leptospiraceae bacterium]